MNIPVLIEPIANNGFRATGGVPFEITVEGATRDEALGRLSPRSTSEWPGAQSSFLWRSLRPRITPGFRARGCFGTIPCLISGRRPFRNTAVSLNQVPKRLVRAASTAPPVLCDRESPSPQPSARHQEPLAERNKFATKAVGIRGRSRLTTLQHSTLALRIALSPHPGSCRAIMLTFITGKCKIGPGSTIWGARTPCPGLKRCWPRKS